MPDNEILNLPKYHLMREAVADARAKQGAFFGDTVYVLFPNAGGWFLTNMKPPLHLLYAILPARGDEDQRVRVNLNSDFIMPHEWLIQ